MKDITKEYTNGEVTIVWKPTLCTHATFCWKELPDVFNPKERPWVNALGANSKRIIEQVKRCPSGALTYHMNNEKKQIMNTENNQTTEVKVHKNGPLFVQGNLTVVREGHENENRPEGAAFCRCGKSQNQPYCDGSHLQHPFE